MTDSNNIDPFDLDDFDPFPRFDAGKAVAKDDLFAPTHNVAPNAELPAPSGLAQMAQQAANHQSQAPVRNAIATYDDYMSGLNEPQRQAVEATEGPLLVLAGAGTGKTRVLTTRLTHILAQHKAWPSQLLVVTFTNKAAREMRQRIGAQIGDAVEGMQWLGTFHAVTAKILRRHAELVGLRSDFTILDPDDQIRMLKTIIRAENVDEKKWPARALANSIDNWKNRGLQPNQVPANEAHDYADGKGIALYQTYQNRLKIANAADFGDMLIECLRLFQENADVLKIYQDRFKYILIDEYQDTNVVQYLWLRLLAGNGKDRPQNVCCVGDDDQSIYGWRGAEVENILRFERDFKGAKTVRLEQNYRSTGHILAAASGVIAHNSDRLGKTLYSKAEDGLKLVVKSVWDGEEEARVICEKIEDFRHEGVDLNEIAILVRTSTLMRAFEDRLSILGIPYRLVGGPKFYERAEIRDVIAYLSLVQNHDNDIKFQRIINVPKRGIGASSLAKMQHFARMNNISLYAAATQMTKDDGFPAALRRKIKKIINTLPYGMDKNISFETALSDAKNKLKPNEIEQFKLYAGHKNMNLLAAAQDLMANEPLTGKTKTELTKLMQNFDRWSGFITEMPHAELAKLIFEESGYNNMWQEATTADAAGRLENLQELVGQIGQFSSLGEFLEHISLVMDVDEQKYNSEMVSLMTLHAVKGLEYEKIFLPAWEEGQFPHQRALDESGQAGLEEERRLAYVGITRAKKYCWISFTANRQVHGQWQNNLPSRFIDEIPLETAEIEQANNQYGNYAQQNTSYLDDHKTGYASDSFNTPGWQRAQKAKQSSGYQNFKSAQKARKVENNFYTGERVYHSKFGYGFVLAADGSRCEIDFDDVGRKKVVASFLEQT
ncbi:MAG: UvrD-helicase domain-containing protein [Hyphomicrobiales bacterium]|nr:UvrD-helicase domain-containing protein [Hyphomicrobiales bacterium]